MGKMMGMTTVVVCAVVVSVIAASTAQAGDKKGSSVVRATGCLQKGSEANSYVLSNASGGGTYELLPAAGVNLAPHVGHKIEVTGSTVKPNKAAKAEGEKGASKKEERGERHLEVRAVKMIAAACP